MSEGTGKQGSGSASRPGWSLPAALTGQRLTELLAVLGVLVLAIAIVLALNGYRKWPLQALLILASMLLFLAAIRSIHGETLLVRSLFFVGASLILLVAIIVTTLTLNQSAQPSSQTRCAVVVAATPPPLSSALYGAIFGPTPTPLPAPTVSPTPPAAAAEVAVNVPHTMGINGSEFAGVVLSHKYLLRAKPVPAPIIVVGGMNCNPSQVQGSTATPTRSRPRSIATPEAFTVGTPGPLAQAFGPGYQAYAAAHIEAIKFDVTPSSSEWQVLDERSDEDWEWTITPKAAGKQVILFNMDVQWVRANKAPGTSAFAARRIWESGPLFVQVEEPVLTAGQIQVSTVVTALFTTAATALISALVAKLITDRPTQK